MTPEELVGGWIKEIRERRGMTQEALGRLVGDYLGKPWPKQTVSAPEQGRRVFAVQELLAVAFALQAPVISLLEPRPEEEVTFPSGKQVGVIRLLTALVRAVPQRDKLPPSEDEVYPFQAFHDTVEPLLDDVMRHAEVVRATAQVLHKMARDAKHYSDQAVPNEEEEK